jgi:hypothetical protein
MHESLTFTFISHSLRRVYISNNLLIWDQNTANFKAQFSFIQKIITKITSATLNGAEEKLVIFMEPK